MSLMILTGRQWRNALARTIVWLAVFGVWIELQKPAETTLAAIRPGVIGVLGAGAVLGGLALLLWCVVVLAGAIPSEARLTGHIIAHGPYRYSRNPLYLAAGTVCLGLYLLYAPWRRVDLPIAVVLLALLQVAVVRFEEPATRRRVGPAYEAYMRQVPRWFPRVWR